MKRYRFLKIALLAASFGVAFQAVEASQYAGQETRDIKALAPEFIEGLKAGAGLGFAKSAELNGYPGPAHLLELAEKLPLNAGQLAAITTIRDEMRAASITLGAELIVAERKLEAAFRARTINQGELALLTLEAGKIRAALRAEHLGAHIRATAVLQPAQIHRYQVLRGYTGGKHSVRPSHSGHVH